MKNLKYSIRIITSLMVLQLLCSCDVKAKTTDKEVAENVTENAVSVTTDEVKIAILLDVSGSMNGLIEQAKSQLWDIVNKFSGIKTSTDGQPKLQIALYEYGSDSYAYKGHIHQIQGFTSDLDDISEKLFSLQTSGSEEYCGQVIQTSLDDLDWGEKKDKLKMIFIAGNEPFTQGEVNYTQAILNSKNKGIVVNTIFCGNYNEGVSGSWKSGAQIGGGEYIAIDHNKKVVHIYTPYDEEIMELNRKLNKTYVSYGSKGVAKKEKQISQDSNAQEMEEAVMIKRAVSKSSRLYKNKSWDLVDAADDKEFEIASINKKTLPAEIKDKSSAEIEAYVKEKKAKRIEIQKEIKEIDQKRKAFITKNQKESSKGELENAMNTAIEKQARAKNYKWSK